MIPSIRLQDLKRAEPDSTSRERTLKAVEDFRKAHDDLVRVCEEKGIEVPIMICQTTKRLTKVQRDAIHDRLLASTEADVTAFRERFAELRNEAKSMEEFETLLDAYFIDWNANNPA